MISKKDIHFLKSILGEDILDALKKSEVSGGLVKLNTTTVLDPNEIKIALEIVPRTVISFLMSKLKDKKEGENCEVDLEFANAKLFCNKYGPDNYSGSIVKEGKKLAEFKHRSLPGVGLIILTTFELYDIDKINAKQNSVDNSDSSEKIQRIIDERLYLHRLIEDVVDRRITQKSAIEKLIQQKLNSHIEQSNSKQEIEVKESPEVENKKSKLKQFLEKREEKRKTPLEITKTEVKCPDCKSTLYKSEKEKKINLCVCFGEHRGSSIFFKKSENGKVKLNFPKNFDIENVEMLLDIIKKK